MTPPITREARDELMRRYRYPQDDDVAFDYYLNSMPLAPAAPLDAVRARFQPKTRGGYEYEIFAERDGELYGRVSASNLWRVVAWAHTGWDINGTECYSLLPASPHAALIAELREAEDHCYHGGMDDTARLFKRAADALEKLP